MPSEEIKEGDSLEDRVTYISEGILPAAFTEKESGELNRAIVELASGKRQCPLAAYSIRNSLRILSLRNREEMSGFPDEYFETEHPWTKDFMANIISSLHSEYEAISRMQYFRPDEDHFNLLKLLACARAVLKDCEQERFMSSISRMQPISICLPPPSVLTPKNLMPLFDIETRSDVNVLNYLSLLNEAVNIGIGAPFEKLFETYYLKTIENLKSIKKMVPFMFGGGGVSKFTLPYVLDVSRYALASAGRFPERLREGIYYSFFNQRTRSRKDPLSEIEKKIHEHEEALLSMDERVYYGLFMNMVRVYSICDPDSREDCIERFIEAGQGLSDAIRGSRSPDEAVSAEKRERWASLFPHKTRKAFFFRESRQFFRDLSYSFFHGMTLDASSLVPVLNDDLSLFFLGQYLRRQKQVGRDERFTFQVLLLNSLLKFPEDERAVFLSKAIDSVHFSRNAISLIGNGEDLENVLEGARYFSPDLTPIKKLGSGREGSTFLVSSNEFKRTVALKAISHPSEEARILSTLSHPNIVRVYYASDDLVKNLGKRGKQYAILMEYVNGQTLREIMDQNKRGLDRHICIDYCGQILDALSYLSQQGIIHRDLSLRNIKVNSNGVVKVMDFGHAQGFPYEALSKGLMTKTSLYHHKNTSDEEVNPRYSGRTDLFSSGLILCELVMGEHLVLPKDEGMPSDVHRELVKRLKRTLLSPEGRLNNLYREKISSRLDSDLSEIAILSLENSGEYNPEGRVAHVQGLYARLRVDKEAKSAMEGVVGRELSATDYLKLLQISRDSFRGQAAPEVP